MSQYEQHVFDAIYGRRSIRSFAEGKEIEHEKIVKLLQAAMAAPSACNIQPWEFVVVTEKEGISAVRESTAGNGDYNTPLAIVVCGNPVDIPWDEDTGIVDCCAAIENMLIAATAMGLGSVWIGGFDMEAIRKALNIPESVYPIGIAYFGYPAEQKEPRTKYVEEAVYWQSYDSQREHRPRPGNLVVARAAREKR